MGQQSHTEFTRPDLLDKLIFAALSACLAGGVKVAFLFLLSISGLHK